MRLVFMGYGGLGATVLRGVAERHPVGLVLTHRTEFSGLGEPDVAETATALGLPVRYSSRATEPDLHEQLRTLAPDLILSTNWRTTVPVEVLDIPRLGAINVHDSLLPRYAGFGAVNWAIRNGETETGLTVHFMDAELDTGAVVTQSRVKIGADCTAGEVLGQLLDEYAPVALRAIDLVLQGHRGEPQDPAQASFYHRIGIEDTRIDWSADSRIVHNLVRGQSDPFVNAWCRHNGERLFVKRVALPRRAYCGTPGRVIKAAEGGVAVACGAPGGPGAQGIVLLDVQPEGAEPVPASEHLTRFGDYLS